MCQRRGVVEIDMAGDHDVIVAGPAAKGCGCGRCVCADEREKAAKGGLLERDYAPELMLVPLVFDSLPKSWRGM